MQLAPVSDSLESRFALLEGGAGGVDDELARMKSAMLLAAPAKRPLLSATMAESGFIDIPVR